MPVISKLNNNPRPSTYKLKFIPICEPIVKGDQVGRNDPCPCGSGKKYKNCHGKA